MAIRPNGKDHSDDTPLSKQERLDRQATAYVFGELDPAAQENFERELAESDELRATVESIRAAVAAIEEEFAESVCEVNAEGRQRIEAAMRQPVSRSTMQTSPSPSRWVIGLAVAATVLLAATLSLPAVMRARDSERLTQELRERIDVIESRYARLEQEKATIEQQIDRLGPSGEVAESASSPQDTTPQMEAAQTERIVSDPISAEEALREPAAESADEAPAASGIAFGPGETRGLSREAQVNGPPEPVAAPGPQEPVAAPVDAFEIDLEGTSTPSAVTSRLSVVETKPVDGNRVAAAHPFPQPESPAGDGGATRSQTADMMGMSGDMGMEMEDAEMMMGGADYDGAVGSTDSLDLATMGGMGAMGGEARQRFVDPGVGRYGWAESERLGLRFKRRQMVVGDSFAPIQDNPFRSVGEAPLSTFSIDVDTASYAKVRMYLMQHNQFPDPNAVRIEELINYFDYQYSPPADERPFSAAMAVAGCPWNPAHRLARIGIKGKVVDDQRPPSNLVFLLDVSGSMNRPNKLPLVLDGMKMLVNQLGENDSIAIVVYAGAAGMVLDSTTGDQKKTIIGALDRLRAGGSTNGGQGIRLAYSIARDNFIVGGTNRVILCSDGDFNVGVTGTDQLVKMAAENAKSDIFLSVLGFGVGNHNDTMMEQISNQGNGNYAFIDTKDEARKVLVEQMQGTLVTIAKDVKIQVEFNPAEVASYRLIGYENRLLAAEDFSDDTKDAGEIGAGHTVTALYELVPAKTRRSGVEDRADPIDTLRYQRTLPLTELAESGEMLTLKLRYKPPTGDTSTLIEFPVTDSEGAFRQADNDLRFAAAVAAFGMLLRNSPHKGDANYAMVEEIAESAVGRDRSGYRDEFLSIVKQARRLSGQ